MKRNSHDKKIAPSLCKLEKHLRSEMEEGYKALAKEQQELARMTFDLQRKTVPEWK